MPRQLSFDYPVGISLGEADFYVSESNRAAYSLIRAPEAWPACKLALVGPAKSGKTHLAGIFAADRGARIFDARGPIPHDHGGAVVLEDLECLPPEAQEDVFHLHNNLAAAGHPLLLTMAVKPARLPVALADLASRLAATVPVAIAAPDDDLLTALLLKHFADRQIMPPQDVVAYIVKRMERSFAAASRLAAEIDREALERKSPITRPIAAAVLDRLQADGT